MSSSLCFWTNLPYAPPKVVLSFFGICARMHWVVDVELPLCTAVPCQQSAPVVTKGFGWPSKPVCTALLAGALSPGRGRGAKVGAAMLQALLTPCSDASFMHTPFPRHPAYVRLLPGRAGHLPPRTAGTAAQPSQTRKATCQLVAGRPGPVGAPRRRSPEHIDPADQIVGGAPGRTVVVRRARIVGHSRDLVPSGGGTSLLPRSVPPLIALCSDRGSDAADIAANDTRSPRQAGRGKGPARPPDLAQPGGRRG